MKENGSVLTSDECAIMWITEDKYMINVKMRTSTWKLSIQLLQDFINMHYGRIYKAKQFVLHWSLLVFATNKGAMKAA